MNDEKRLYMPMVPYVMSRRESLLPGQTYHPFTIVKDRPVLPQNGQAYTFLDGNYVPCTSADDAVYAWHYACLPPPAGFVLCNPGFNKYGEPLPTVQNFTDSEIFTMRQTLTLLPDTQPASRALTGKENTATVSHKPKAVLVNGRGEVLSSSDEVEELQYQLIVGGDGYYLNIPKREKLLRVTNFIIHLLQIRHYISQNNNSEEERRKIFLEVKLFGPNRSVSLEIPYEQISQILDFVKKKVGDANVFDREQIFAKRLEVMMRSSLQDCEITYEYNCSGWAVLPTTQRIYICDSVTPPAGNVYFNCNFAFGHGPSIRSDRDVVLDAFELLALSEDRPKIIIPFLWAHMGLLFSIFSEAGYPPRALLFINGVSGSLKTAVAKLLFNFTAKPEYDIPASFRDTSASMEISIATYVDRVLLVDDYCPAANQASRRVMEQTLENLIRFYGDGNTKARATPSMDVVNIKKAGGVCVITGEDTAGSLSSQLRCLFLSVEKGTYKGPVLQRFQEAPYRWTEYLELFTQRVLRMFPNLPELISKKFSVYRKLAETQMKERRLVDICATLMLVSQIVLEVAGQIAGENLVDQYREEFNNAVLRTGMESEGRAKRQNPAKIFSMAVLAMHQRNDIRIATVENFVADPKSFLGVEKDGYWYLWPNEVFRAVVQYYEAGGQTFPLTQTALWAALAAEDVLIPTKTSRGKEYGTKAPFGNRPRLLKINPQRLAVLAEYG